MSAGRLFMMITVFAAAFAAAGHAQPPTGTPPPLLAAPGAQGGPEAAAPLKFTVYAVKGQKEAGDKNGLEGDLAPVAPLLKGLPFGRYERVTVLEREITDGVETDFPINASYSLKVLPQGQDEKGAARLDLHVDLMQEGRQVKALTAQAAAKPGDALLLRGMPLDGDELVLVVQRDRGEQSGQQQQSGEDQQQPQEQQDKQEQRGGDEKNSDKDKQEQEQQEQEKEKEKAEKKEQEQREKAQAQEQQAEEGEKEPPSDDTKAEDTEKKESGNLESILQSLEEVDRKEQAEVRNRRDRIDFKGGWW